MGLSLFNRRICNTYPGIIKTCDNTPITSTPKAMSDGVGNNVPLAIGTAGVDYTGTQDFSGATVVGLGVTSAGVVAGTGTSSFKVADALVSVPATASSIGAIALGDGMCVTGVRGIGIGFLNQVSGGDGIAIGSVSCAIGAQSIVLGSSAFTCAIGGTSIGTGAKVFPTGLNGTALGCNSAVCAINAVALGAAVTACCSCTVTACSMFLCVPSTPTVGGLLINDAGSTTRRLNITASGTLQIDGSPICADAGLVNDTGTCSIKVASDLVASPAIASGACSVAIGNDARSIGDQSITLGLGSQVECANGIAIGCGAISTGECNVIFPPQVVYQWPSISIGKEVCSYNGGIGVGSRICVGGNGVVMGLCNINVCCAGNIVFGTRNYILNNSESTRMFGYYNVVLANGGDQHVLVGSDNEVDDPINQCGRITAVGSANLSYSQFTTAVGYGNINYSGADNSTSVGVYNRNYCPNTTTLGSGNWANCSGSIGIGWSNRVCAKCAIAIGFSVTACRCNTLTTCQLETCVAGCGLIVRTPDNTKSYKIAVDNSGNITTALA